MKVFYSDEFVLPLPPGHRFSMQKYRMLRERVEVSLAHIELREVPIAGDQDLERGHSRRYIGQVAHGNLDATQLHQGNCLKLSFKSRFSRQLIGQFSQSSAIAPPRIGTLKYYKIVPD